MRKQKETTPSRQASGVASGNTHMVAQPARKFTRSDAWLTFAAAIATFAFITWGEAGAVPAIFGAITSLAVLAALDVAFEGEWC